MGDNTTLQYFFNTADYSIIDFIVVGLGTLCWVISYAAIIRHGFKNKFVEMPVYVAIGNIAWEFVWSFIFKTDMGQFFVWGYRAWFFLDLFILFLVFKYGAKQFTIPQLKKALKPVLIGLILFFTAFFYYFVKGGFDTPIGATSAFFLSVGISTLYIMLLWRNGNPNNFSLLAGVTRALGDSVLTLFAIYYYPHIKIIMIMGIYVVILDVVYVVLLTRLKRQSVQKSA